MKITICGSMRFLPVMMALSGWLRQHGVEDVKIPEDIRPKSLHDEEFTSVLIKRRADHIINIDKSDLVIVACESYEGHDTPRMIHSSEFDPWRLDKETRDMSITSRLPVDVPDFIKSWSTPHAKYNELSLYECSMGYKIGESTSFELISAIHSRVPVLIMPANDQQWVCYPDTLNVKKEEVYLCTSL